MREQLAEANKIKPSILKKKRGFFSYLILFITASLLFLILLVSVTQTSVFKNWLKDFASDKFNDEFGTKGASLKIGSLEGNLFSEVIINNALLKINKDEAVRFDRVKVTFSIFKLFDKEIEVSDITLLNPSVNFVKIVTPGGDSVWNIAYIFESEEKKEEEPGEFDWKINVQRLRIEKLNFVMLGSKPGDIPIQALQIINEKSFNTGNLNISNFSIETRIQYDKNAAQLWINYLGFKTNFGFDLKGLSGDFYISESRAEINKLNIETSRSWLQMDYVFIDKINLMKVEGLPSFKGKDLRLSMTAKNFDFDDLKSFLPAVDFLDRDVFLELKCKGKFDDMFIEKCAFKTTNSNLNFTGRMINLNDPEQLWFDVAANDIKLDPEDTKIYTPGLPVPDYSHVGVVTGSLTYKGEPLEFYTTFDINSAIGSVKGFYEMNLKNNAITYKTSVDAKSVNIGKLVKDPGLESDITGKIEADGRGFDPASINSNVKYELTNTKIFEQKIDKSSGVINIRGYNIEADLNYVSGKFDSEIKGNINIRDLSNPVYELKGKAVNLDISQFTKNIDDKSNLTFEFDINGRGISPENIEGTYNINISESFYGKYDLPATPVNLKVSTSGAHDIVSLRSNLIEFNAEGSFKIEQIADVVINNIRMIQNKISKKFNLDTLMPRQDADITGTYMDFVYEMRTKDPDAVARIFFLSDLNFAGDVKGYIKNSQSGFSGESIININKLSYDDTLFAVKNASAVLIHNNNYADYRQAPAGNFNPFTSSIDIKAEKMIVSGTVYDSISAFVKLSDGNQEFNFSCRKDSTLSAGFTGKIDLTSDSVDIDISKLNLYYNKFILTNQNPVQITYNPASDERSFNFKQFTFVSNIVNINLSGKYSISGNSDLTADLKNIDIPSILQYAYDPQSVYAVKESGKFKTPLTGKIRRLSFYFKGTMESPELSMEMNTGTLRYEQIKVGRIDAFIDYANQNLTTDVLVRNTQGEGSLRLNGGIPFSNPLSTPDSAEYAEVLKKPLELRLQAKNFQINFFSKLIPNFSEVRGFLNGELNAKGTISEPVFTGNASIEKGRFFFSWNGLYYRFETRLKAEKSELIVEEFKVFNDNARDRFINIWGTIQFAGLGINEINLQTSGDMFFLDGSSIQNRFGFSGEMLAGSGNPPIRIKGSPSNLTVSGQLVIKSARLFFPSIQGLAYDIYSDDFTYRIITDEKTQKYLDTLIIAAEDELESIDPFLRYNYELSKREPSVADFINYDMEIITEKNIYINMIMNPLTREELFGEITGNLKLDNKTADRRFQMFGDMNIVGDSYYRFYKNFKIIDSKLEFRGDYLDPKIEINAEYKNVRTVEEGTEIMYVLLEIRGTRNKPELTLKLIPENGNEITGSDVQSEALSYLIFGQPLSNIRSNSKKEIFKNLSANIGTSVFNSLLYQALREIAPFILNTEVIYTGGDIKGTDIKITTGFGDAIVKFGGKIFSSINNFEVSVEYPLNKLFDINVSNNLLLEISRELSNSYLNYNEDFETKVGITYKIRY